MTKTEEAIREFEDTLRQWLEDFSLSEWIEERGNLGTKKFIADFAVGLQSSLRQKELQELVKSVEGMKVGNHPSLNNSSAIRYNTLENVIELLKKSLSTL